MPWYKIELNVGISDKLANYIYQTYGGGGQTIKVFKRVGNHTLIIAFSPTLAGINNALQDIRTRLVEVEETDYVPVE